MGFLGSNQMKRAINSELGCRKMSSQSGSKKSKVNGQRFRSGSGQRIRSINGSGPRIVSWVWFHDLGYIHGYQVHGLGYKFGHQFWIATTGPTTHFTQHNKYRVYNPQQYLHKHSDKTTRLLENVEEQSSHNTKDDFSTLRTAE